MQQEGISCTGMELDWSSWFTLTLPCDISPLPVCFTKELFTLTSLTSDLVCLENPKSCPGPLAAAVVLQTFLSPSTHSHPHHCDHSYQLEILFAGKFLVVSLWHVASQIGTLLIVDWISSPIHIHQAFWWNHHGGEIKKIGSGFKLVLVWFSCFSDLS